MGKILHFQKPINRSERKGKQKNQLLTVGLYIVFVDCCLLFFFFLIAVVVWNISFLRIYFFVKDAEDLVLNSKQWYLKNHSFIF